MLNFQYRTPGYKEKETALGKRPVQLFVNLLCGIECNELAR